MRQFENKNFTHRLAESIESSLITTPDEEANTALNYIRQFIYLTSSNAELKRGYISENFLDALIRTRDANNNRDFNSAVEALGVEGETSTEVTKYNELTFIEIENSFEAEQAVSKLTREYSNELSDEARTTLYSIRDLITDNRDTILYYLPQELANEIMPYLDNENILL